MHKGAKVGYSKFNHSTALGRMKRVWVVAVYALLICLASSNVRAQSPSIVVEKAFFEDVTGRLLQSQVVDKTFKPFAGVLRAGFGDSALWVRLNVSGAASENQGTRGSLVLRITPTFLDSVTIYQTCGKGTTFQALGDQFPISNQAYKALSLNLALEPCAVSNPIWLRVETTSTRSIDIDVLPLDEAVDVDLERFVSIILRAFTIIFLLGIIAVYQGKLNDPVLQAFALQQLVLSAVVLLNNGVGRLATGIDPLVMDRFSSLMTVIGAMALLYFNIRFLQSYKTSRLLLPITSILMAISCVNLALVFSDWRGKAMFGNAVIISFSTVFLFFVTITIKKNKSNEELLPKWLVIFYYGSLTIFVAAPLAGTLGYFGYYTPDIATVYGVFSTFVMSSMLLMRARWKKRIFNAEILELAIGLQKIKQEQKYRDQQEQLFTMLVHEVKTPITALKIAMKNTESNEILREKAARHLDAITNIINHCNAAYRLDDPTFKVSESQVEIFQVIESSIGGNDIKVLIGSGVPETMNTDRQLFNTIVGNLIDNAVRYKKEDTIPTLSVDLKTRETRTGLSIELCNVPGVSGIPDEKRIFEKYYRANNAHHTSGSGLGLFLAYHSALRLGGNIEYVYDGIIRFRLWLPLSK